MVGAIARTIGPIFVSALFEHKGPAITWLMEIIVLIIIITLWIIFSKWMTPYKANGLLEDSISCEDIGQRNDAISTEASKKSIVEKF